MSYLRLLINGRALQRALADGNIDRRIWGLMDAFRDRMLGSYSESMVYEALSSVIFYNASINDFVCSLRKLYEEKKNK